MGYDLTNKKGEFRLTIHFFPKLLRLALPYDWIPQGTLKIEATGWDGSYLKNSFQRVGALDALNLAGALERALDEIPELDTTVEPQIYRKEIRPQEDPLAVPLYLAGVISSLQDAFYTPSRDEKSKLLYEMGNRETREEIREFIDYCKAGDGFIIS